MGWRLDGRLPSARISRFPPAIRSRRKKPHEHPTPEDAAQHLDAAVNGLKRRYPELSAGEPVWLRQKCWLAALAVAGIACASVSIPGTIFALFALMARPFSCVIAVKLAALWHVATASRPPDPPADLHPHALPRYSLLIPLFNEADVVPDLLAALDRLDYPRDRLEILLILEQDDHATRAAIQSRVLLPHMSVVVVPAGQPQTKPRALNYAFARATGDVIVVYDAEDLPDPDQLRRASARLLADPGIGCLQARLHILNDRENWLTRQFAIEYAALFDATLPALQRLGLPLPLGGTSNHFPRRVLDEVGAWDPFNVTEDADLGIRLARRGYRVEVLPSTTWEEAPVSLRAWRNQRTRWLKGWMQTYLVHMRRPMTTARELGWFRFLGVQVLMGGLILSALVHPWFYAAVVWAALAGPNAAFAFDLSSPVAIVGLSNLVLGYVTGIALGAVAAGRKRRNLIRASLGMPIYWMLISLAAYRALFHLIRKPYRWEKTPHRPRNAFTTPGLTSA